MKINLFFILLILASCSKKPEATLSTGNGDDEDKKIQVYVDKIYDIINDKKFSPDEQEAKMRKMLEYMGEKNAIRRGVVEERQIEKLPPEQQQEEKDRKEKFELLRKKSAELFKERQKAIDNKDVEKQKKIEEEIQQLTVKYNPRPPGMPPMPPIPLPPANRPSKKEHNKVPIPVPVPPPSK